MAFDPKEATRFSERSKVDNFDAWLEKPEIKMLISLLPPLETDVHRDCFRALMRSAFLSGHDAGAGSTAATMLEAMLSSERGRKP